MACANGVAMSNLIIDNPIEDAGADESDGLYLSDRQIIRRLGFGEKFGRRVLHELDKAHPGRARYPQKDPLFGNRRFWPAVLKWHMDYHRVMATEQQHNVSTPRWQENFDAPRKAG
jgi:hypothetical protein